MSTMEEILDEIRSVSDRIPVADILYAVHISLEHKYLYTITPKCACSMIRLALRQFELAEPTTLPANMALIHARDFHPTLDPRQVGSFKKFLQREDIFKFCFVREPYVRLLSSYLDRIGRAKAEKRGVLDQLGLAAHPIDTPLSFETFVRHVATQSVAEMNPHWRVQYHQTLQGAIRYDFIGRVERFPDDIRTVANRIHPDFLTYVPGEPLNVTEAARQLDEYYTPELVGIVNETFALDFKTFGYPMR